MLSGCGAVAVSRKPFATHSEELDEDYAREKTADVRPVRDAAPGSPAGAEVRAERQEAIEGLEREPVADDDPGRQDQRDEDNPQPDDVAHPAARPQDDVAAENAGDRTTGT